MGNTHVNIQTKKTKALILEVCKDSTNKVNEHCSCLYNANVAATFLSGFPVLFFFFSDKNLFLRSAQWFGSDICLEVL